jgi:hypothetical protein
MIIRTPSVPYHNICSMHEKIFSLQYLRKSIYRAKHWETWHWLVKYIPMVPFWIWYCLKARSIWFFTASNPTLTFGGYEGENKMEMYALLPRGTYPRTIFIRAGQPYAEIEARVLSAGFSFPVAVKPDVGRMGLMFRKINSLHELIKYHERMKANYVLQEFIHYPLEVSIFYYRFPGDNRGTITGFVRKEYLSVNGDGVSTLFQLMLNYGRIKFRLEEMKLKHADRLDHVIPLGEKYVLSEALNLSRGGKLISLEHEKDERLLNLFDNLSHTGHFHFGRYDIKCSSIAELKDGKNFSILEFNGSGAEPHHVYGNGNSIIKAINILLDHWKILCEISIENHKKGIPYWTFTRGLLHMRQARKQIKMLRQLEFSLETQPIGVAEKSMRDKVVLQHYELT